VTLRAVIMGVSGCGKTSVGLGVSAALGVRFVDGDDLHPAANVAKMAAGIPLTDEDRRPWLDRVAGVLADRAPVIVGCSALRRVYRDRLRRAGEVRFIHLTGPRDLIAARMTARTGHYMPPALLDSQFAALEVPGPDEAVAVSIDAPLDEIVARATEALR
jgi:gluconokinase